MWDWEALELHLHIHMVVNGLVQLIRKRLTTQICNLLSNDITLHCDQPISFAHDPRQ